MTHPTHLEEVERPPVLYCRGHIAVLQRAASLLYHLLSCTLCCGLKQQLLHGVGWLGSEASAGWKMLALKYFLQLVCLHMCKCTCMQPTTCTSHDLCHK
jgi:hypothetical protein